MAPNQIRGNYSAKQEEQEINFSRKPSLKSFFEAGSSPPKVRWAKVGWESWAGEEMGDGVVFCATFRAQWGGCSANSMEIVPHGRGEARPQLREGGPDVAGEAFLLGAHRRGPVPEDPVWGG